MMKELAEKINKAIIKLEALELAPTNKRRVREIQSIIEEHMAELEYGESSFDAYMEKERGAHIPSTVMELQKKHFPIPMSTDPRPDIETIIKKMDDSYEGISPFPDLEAEARGFFSSWGYTDVPVDVEENQIAMLAQFAQQVIEQDRAARLHPSSCDYCGCEPTVIICTEKGKFCQEHVKY